MILFIMKLHLKYIIYYKHTFVCVYQNTSLKNIVVII